MGYEIAGVQHGVFGRVAQSQPVRNAGDEFFGADACGQRETFDVDAKAVDHILSRRGAYGQQNCNAGRIAALGVF